MKKITLAGLLIASTITLLTSPAHAISAKYRQQLEQSGCTQVTDADGSCDIHKTKSQNAKQNIGVKSLSADAEFVKNKPISDSAEYLLSKDWKPNNGLWKKQGYTLKLTVEKETVISAKLSKD